MEHETIRESEASRAFPACIGLVLSHRYERQSQADLQVLGRKPVELFVHENRPGCFVINTGVVVDYFQVLLLGESGQLDAVHPGEVRVGVVQVNRRVLAWVLLMSEEERC